ncbi:hypothetical protein [Mucilaginibacter pedocola]|uniref:DUF5640 domain-containing protein n=1 Tax=Mucilaginibacter pedocola TaxID=1792845 RepID=A0A1S9PA26_9SPHI|nr:hypothetical protein [Mucilaginibacter pedocola]OOQ57438.1 hypothetical protein BC343_15185 [Mucilaginibacter pedocola]
MKTITPTLIYIGSALILLTAACGNGTKTEENKQLQGNWKAKDGTELKITAKQFTMDNQPEDYFIKGDTIFTSFEGNLPYTKFVIKKLDEKQLNLVFPDDTAAVEFSR